MTNHMELDNPALRPKKASVLIEYLTDKIVSGELPAGSRIPPIRKLIEQFPISFASAQRGLSYMIEQGFLTKNGKAIIAGNINRELLNAPDRRIFIYIAPRCFIQNNYSPGILLTAFLQIQRRALSMGFSVQAVAKFLQADDIAELSSLSGKCGGAIILQEMDQNIAELRPDVPMVALLTRSNYNGLISNIDLDPYHGAETAMRYFESAGFRMVEVITDPRPVYRHRAELFRFLWQEKYGTLPPLKVLTSVKSVPFRKNTGYFFTSDSILDDVLHQYSEEHPGKELPSGNLLLGMDGKNLISPEFHHFSTIAADWSMIGDAAFDECIRLMRNPGTPRRRILFPGRLYINNKIRLKKDS